MTDLTLQQELALAEFFASYFAGVRKNDLNPEAAASMTTGERIAVKFAGQVVAWVSLPKAATRASVNDEKALLSWCRKNFPDAIETVERVRPETAKALAEQMKTRGGWVSPDGEKIPVDGIEVKDGTPSPRVELQDAAAGAIGAAWRAGEIDLGQVLALPPAEAEAA